MFKKEVVILISGKLTFYDDKNINKIRESLKNFEIKFYFVAWENQNQSIIDKFKRKYKPVNFEKIAVLNFDEKLKKIKYPDYAGNTLATLHMYKSICIAFEKINKFYLDKQKKPDYILRYRSDILPKNDQTLMLENELKKGQILIPDRYHWNGLNDQIFMINFKDIEIFKNFDSFLNDHINKNRFFCSEYLFQRFIKKNKFKIIFSSFDYNIMRFKNYNKSSKSIRSKKLFIDWINCKMNRLKYKMRNFKEHFIQKTNRNNKQDILVDLDESVT